MTSRGGSSGKHKGDSLFDDIIHNCKLFPSPIDLNLGNMTQTNVDELKWVNYQNPTKKIKISNSGHTLIITAKWNREFPYVTHGPFANKFIFSQVHFHWGATDQEGSEHTFDGVKYPLEMHVVHYNEDYATLNHALKQKNGVVIIVYVFQLQTQMNEEIQFILNGIPHIKNAQSHWRAENVALDSLIRAFYNDYFLYWGSLETAQFTHDILWMICREPLGISYKQMQAFRTLLDENEELQLKNYRPTIETPPDAAIYHVNPSGQTYATLLAANPRDVGKKQ